MTEETTITKTEASPMSLIQAAIDQNVDVERLDALMKLQERWENSKSIKSYHKAMNKCQQEMPTVVKNRENTHTRSRYAQLEVVVHSIKPIYTAHGFSISFNEKVVAEIPNCVVLMGKLRHDEGHSEDFELCVPLDGVGVKGNANMTGIQAKGSTITYARRYLTLMMFNIAVADEDLDGNPPSAVLNDEEIATIKTLVDGCRAANATVDMNKFMAVFGVATIAEIPHHKFASAVDMLSKKLAKAKQEAVSK